MRVVLALALVAASTAWEGVVLKILWNWFMVPMFGLPPLTVWLAVGVTLVVGMAMPFVQPKEADAEADAEKMAGKIAYVCVYGAVRAGLYLLLGWVVHFFARPL